MLAASNRPLILAGGGVILSDASKQLQAFAEHVNVPVYSTFMGKGALSARHPLHLGIAGCWGEYPATEAARNADVILALGARFSDIHCSSWVPGYTYNIPPTRLIHVDLDPTEIGRNYPTELGIVGDAREVLTQLLELGLQPVVSVLGEPGLRRHHHGPELRPVRGADHGPDDGRDVGVLRDQRRAHRGHRAGGVHPVAAGIDRDVPCAGEAPENPCATLPPTPRPASVAAARLALQHQEHARILALLEARREEVGARQRDGEGPIVEGAYLVGIRHDGAEVAQWSVGQLRHEHLILPTGR